MTTITSWWRQGGLGESKQKRCSQKPVNMCPGLTTSSVAKSTLFPHTKTTLSYQDLNCVRGRVTCTRNPEQLPRGRVMCTGHPEQLPHLTSIVECNISSLKESTEQGRLRRRGSHFARTQISMYSCIRVFSLTCSVWPAAGLKLSICSLHACHNAERVQAANADLKPAGGQMLHVTLKNVLTLISQAELQSQ